MLRLARIWSSRQALETTFATLRFRYYEHEKLAGLDHLAGFDVDLLDGPRDLGRQHVLHFHRFEDQQGIAGSDLASGLHGDLENLPRHRRARFWIAVGPCRTLRLGLAAEIELETFAPPGDPQSAAGALGEQADRPAGDP